MTVWAIALVVALMTLARRRHEPLSGDARWLMFPALLIAALFAWRDSDSLAAYNLLAFAGTFALLGAAVANGSKRTIVGSRVRDVVESAITAGAGALFGMFPLVLRDVSLREVATARGASRVFAGVRAAVIAIPLLLVFGGLFSSADPMFARIVGEAFHIDFAQVATHLALTGFFAWVVGGFLRTALLSNHRSRISATFPDGALGLTEISVALGSLVLLFAAFVAVQFRYFFGGQALITQTAGMSYADYARRGFFELVTVSALVLPVLLSAHALLRRETPRADSVYRVLASALLALLGVIMYSAIARMRLYQSVYGLSTDRLYATVFMGWLAVVFAWFAVTVLRGRTRTFVAGVLVSAWGTLVALNVANPAGFVARSNIARAAQGKALDVSYIESLGADAAPALIGYLVRQPLTPPSSWVSALGSVLPTVGSTPSAAGDGQTRGETDDYTARCQAARSLLLHWRSAAAQDWRGWTVGAARAHRSVLASEPSLRTLAGTEWNGKVYVRCAERPTPPSAATAVGGNVAATPAPR